MWTHIAKLISKGSHLSPQGPEGKFPSTFNSLWWYFSFDKDALFSIFSGDPGKEVFPTSFPISFINSALPVFVCWVNQNSQN